MPISMSTEHVQTPSVRSRRQSILSGFKSGPLGTAGTLAFPSQFSKYGRQTFHRSHPFEFALNVGMQAVAPLDRREVGADNIDLIQFVLPQADLPAISQVSDKPVPALSKNCLREINTE